MKKNYRLRKLKAKKSYSSSELADLLGVHVQTVRSWNREGMQPIDPDSHYPLFLGLEIKQFLKKQRDSRKVKLKAGEFYCLRCRTAVTPKRIKTIDRKVKIGKQKQSILLTGFCPVCNCLVNKFSVKGSKTAEKPKEINSGLQLPLIDSLTNNTE